MHLRYNHFRLIVFKFSYFKPFSRAPTFLPGYSRLLDPVHRVSLIDFDSAEYWKKRYAAGGNSGGGSYGALADFKAQSLNCFIQENSVNSIVEYGSGDGNQLGLIKVANYLGLDVSPDAIKRTNDNYATDPSKRFQLYDPDTFKTTPNEQADMSISMDVILHLTEDARYEKYMGYLFKSGIRFIGIFNTATDKQLEKMALHNRYRDHRNWITKNSEFVEVKVEMLPASIGYPTETGFFYYAAT